MTMCTTLISTMKSIVVLLIVASLLACAVSTKTAYNVDKEIQTKLSRFMRDVKNDSDTKVLAEMASDSVKNLSPNTNTAIVAYNTTNVEKYQAIYPGTKWCGAGNISTGYNDLGVARKEDMCCRAHDYCEPYIDSFTTSAKFNITNFTPISKFECTCDVNFMKCLKAVGSKVSKSIGTLYFSVLGNQCFRKDYPITGCKTRYPANLLRCKVYNYNTKGTKIYQFVDSAMY